MPLPGSSGNGGHDLSPAFDAVASSGSSSARAGGASAAAGAAAGAAAVAGSKRARIEERSDDSDFDVEDSE